MNAKFHRDPEHRPLQAPAGDGNSSDKRKILLQLLAEEKAKRAAHVEAERAQNWRVRK
jgi:hypothetical protein